MQEASANCVYTKGIDVPCVSVCGCFCCFCLVHTVAYPVCVHLCYVCVQVCVFVLLKGLAQSRPFVLGSGGHSAQLVWFMDVRQNCIRLWPEKHCPSSCCETHKCANTDNIK